MKRYFKLGAFIRNIFILIIALTLLAVFIGCSNNTNDDYTFASGIAGSGSIEDPNNNNYSSNNNNNNSNDTTNNSDNSQGSDTQNNNNNSSGGYQGVPVIADNNPGDAIRDAFTVLYGGLDAISPDKIRNIAPEAFWNYIEKNDTSFSIDNISDKFYNLMIERERIYDNAEEDGYNQYLDGGKKTEMVHFYGYYSDNVKEYESYDLKAIQEELYQKYGIDQSSVKAAATAKYSIIYYFDSIETLDYVRKMYRKSSKISYTDIQTVQIDNKWYVYDHGMFYPELITAIVTSGDGFNYLMEAKWLQ